MLLVIAVLAPAIALTGCAETDSELDPGSAANVGQPAPAEQPAGLAAAQPNALTSIGALELLPADTMMVGALANPAGLAEQLGWSQLVQTFPQIAEAARDKAKILGAFDPLDLSQWSALGLDTSGAAGFAWRGIEHPIGALFVRTTGDPVFETALTALFGRLTGIVSLRDAGAARVGTVTVDNETVYLVLRDGWAFVVFGSGDRNAPEDHVKAFAMAIATQEAGTSLAASELFQETMDRVSFGPKGGLFVNLAAVTSEGIATLRSEHLERSESEHDSLQQMVQRERGLALAEATLGGFRGLAIGGDLQSGVALTRAAVTFNDRALLADLPVNRMRPSVVARSLGGAPLILTDGAASPQTIESIARLVAGAFGADIDRGLHLFKAFAGTEQGLFELMSGDLGFALLRQESEGTKSRVGATVAIGLTDDEAGKQILAKIAALAPLTGLIQPDAKTGDITIATPHWHAVHIGIADGALVATTDPSALERLRSDAVATYVQAYTNPRLQALLAGSGTAGTWLVSPRVFEGVHRRWHGPLGEEPAYEASEPPLVRGKRAELWRLRVEIDRVQTEREARLGALGKQLMDQIGQSAMVGTRTAWGWRFVAGMFFDAPTHGEWVVGAAAAAKALHQAEEGFRKQLRPLRDKRSDAERELNELLTPPAENIGAESLQP